MTNPKITYNDTDSTTKATMIAAAMVNAVHPDDRSISLYEDAAAEASQWLDDQAVGCPDTSDILTNLSTMFDVDYWE